MTNEAKSVMVSLARVRVRLATLWLVCSSVIFTLVMAQAVRGMYIDEKTGDHAADLWKWLLPNLIPTLTTMIVALAATATVEKDEMYVRRDFYLLTAGLSVFYLFLLFGLLVCQPVIHSYTVDRITSLQNSNLGTGPIQGLVAAALGVLFGTGKVGEAASAKDDGSVHDQPKDEAVDAEPHQTQGTAPGASEAG